MSDTPLISVIIPVFNREKYIQACIESALAQTYTPIEIICIDDASTDTSVEIIKQFIPKVTLITKDKNTGAGYTRNCGIDRAKGTFIAFLDSDDLWDKHKLEKQMVQFFNEPDLAISMTQMQNFISPEFTQGVLTFEEPIAGVTSSTMVIRKNDFFKAGYFSNALADFPEWFIRAKQVELKTQILPEVLVYRRIHDTNIGRQLQKDKHNYLSIIRKFLQSKK